MSETQELERLRLLRFTVRQLLSDLPTNRDWLDPLVEAELRRLSSDVGYPTYQLYEVTRVYETKQRFLATSEDEVKVLAEETDRASWLRNSNRVEDRIVLAPKQKTS